MGVDGNGKGAADRIVAVVGAACRLPGGIADLDALWRALREGRDLITEAPADRFDSSRFVDAAMPRPGKSYTAAGGFLDDIGGFDASYFGISPREAAQMDPQQRLLLELAAEACDDAAVAPAALAGTDTAVYVGVCDNSYGALQFMNRSVNAYTMSGAASSIAANRISHVMDLHGPSLVVDTACSSSLVALVQACRDLQAGTSRTALAGGANVLLNPYHYVGFSQASMLSPTGRCRSFSAGADGYVRAEGGGMVLLKRLPDALADGDRIHALILAGAVNSDGRTPGISLPRMQLQERLLREVYEHAGVAPDDIAYLEAHGTGTPAGDPVEAEAIGRALGSRRTHGELPIGSVKSNLGHLEPASGMAGLMKALLVLREGEIPPTLHADEPTSHVDFAALRLALAVRPRPAALGEHSVVGVNSFGFGGTNAHVILAPPPAPPAWPAPPPPAERPVLVTARTRRALADALHRTAAHLAQAPDEDFYDLAYTATMRRGQHPHRAAVLAPDPSTAAERLEALAQSLAPEPRQGRGELRDQPQRTRSEDDRAGGGARGPQAPLGDGERAGQGHPTAPADGWQQRVSSLLQQPEPFTAAGTPGDAEGSDPDRPAPATRLAALGTGTAHGRTVFVFAGNGGQWRGMGEALMAADPGFRETVETLDALLAPRLGWSIARAMADPGSGPDLSATEYAQPLLFALQVGLVGMLRRQGVTPAAVVGHSVGEVAAAHTAGALDLAQAAAVIAARVRAQAPTAGSGGMTAVSLPRHEAENVLAGHPGLGIACDNTDGDVTVSGPTAQLAALEAELTCKGVAYSRLDVDYAFHSPAMDAARDLIGTDLAQLRPAPVTVPMVSTVTGAPVTGTELDADHWWRNVREPVLFTPAVQHLLATGHDVFVEIGPHPVVRPYLRRLTRKHPTPVAVVPTLAKDDAGPHAVRTAVAALAAAGADLDWRHHYPVPGRVADLPAYPWQRERHWNGSPGIWSGVPGDGGVDHPLLGDRLVPLHQPTWRGPVEPALAPWLADHRVGGAVVWPATGYVEMALAAGRRVLDAPAEVEHLEITRALVVPWDDPGSTVLHLTVSPDDGAVTITSVTGDRSAPTRHARARVRRLLRPRPGPLDITAVRRRCTASCDPAELYRTATTAGLDYGPTFRTLRRLYTGDGEVLAAYEIQEPCDAYEAHPALLDGALQAGLPLMAGALARGEAYLPSGIEAVRVWQAPPARGLVHLRERPRTATEVCWDITVTAPDGTVAAELQGCRLRRFDGARAAPLIRSVSVLRAAPRTELPCPPSPLPSCTDLVSRARPRIEAARDALRASGYERGRRMNLLISAILFLEGLRGLLPAGERILALDGESAPPLRPHHRQLCTWVLPVLARRGLAERLPDGRWALQPSAVGVDDVLRRVVHELPAFSTEVALAAFHRGALTKVLLGEKQELEFLAEGGIELMDQFFDLAPFTRCQNRMLRALMEEIVRQWPADRPLRILEVGGGTGGATAGLLAVLPPERTRYTFTDVSRYFIGRAEKRFARHDFVEYRPFDLDADPAEQGLTPGGFDVVVAANALHTAKDLVPALRRVAGLLAPGGRLLASEQHNVEAMAPYFATLESFWHHTDRDLRPEVLPLPAHRWPSLLRQCGFTDVVGLGEGRRRTAGADGSVLLATAAGTAVPPAAPSPSGTAGAWILAAEGAGENEPRALADALRQCTDSPVRITGAPDDTTTWDRLLARDTGDVTVVLLLDPAAPDPGPGEVVGLTARRIAVLAALASAGERLPAGTGLTVWLVTKPSGALPAPERPEAPHDAAIWGAARTMANEHPRITVRRLSFERTVDPGADAHRLARELLTDTEEDEIALTAGGRFVPRVVDLAERPQLTADSRTVAAFALEVRDPGLAYRLAWTETAAPAAPGFGQVLVAVRAAALNYRDIMHAIGVLPQAEVLRELPRQPGPGMECAGVVEAVGPGVNTVAVGDRVFGLAPGALASHTLTTEHALAPIPARMSFTEAATLPVVFLTVHYGLGHLARLRRGETVLVHGAAGGVGLAALQYARRCGARVIATAGSTAKRHLLHALGVEHVLDSRDLTFAEQVRRITGGEGVDVVLNSLAGEAIARGLDVLRPGGRFVELGKRDILEDKPLRLRPFSKNIAFFGVDLVRLLHDPELAMRQFAEVAALVRCGRYRPLLHTVHPAARAEEAFRLLQHSRHIGKVVVAFDPLDEPLYVERAPAPPPIDPKGTYLVAGGLGGFGAATARWLAGHGARHLDLVGRRGPDSPEAAQLLADLAARGAEARAHAADVGDADAIEAIAAQADAEGRPLRGVVHSAMHIDDAFLARVTDEQVRAVLRPKMAGGAVLDAVTRGRDLGLFLAHSSVTATFGHLFQATYGAGNLYLEALARRRRWQGLPATAIAWGAIGGTGYVVRNDMLTLLKQAGIEPVMPQEALEAAAQLLAAGADVAGVGRYNWGRIHTLLQCVGAPRLGALLPASTTGGFLTREDLRRKLACMAPDEAHQYISGSLARVLAEVLQIPVEEIDHHRRIDSFGVDSLMATEALAMLRRQYDVEIPPMELLRSEGTIADIARIIQLRLGLAAGQQPPAALPGARQEQVTDAAADR
ncbi:SDR family NAD(P)-dependent oxidoreductase [Streptomyces sp. NPDC049555]|uniref:SDR family NAD(P)-dependent oxidoreductase n=1 Tax=unclassified Streptomyces TaxID=2593676 RepID=UPI003442B6C3